MSIVQQLARLNPLRILRATDAVPRLQEIGGKLRDDQKEVTRQLRALTRQIERLEQTVTSQGELLASFPELQSRIENCQSRIEQCIVAYEQDAAYADALPAIQQKLDAARCARHATVAVSRAELSTDPCPHVVIENLLPEELCDELVNAIPLPLFFRGENKTRQELKVPFVFAPEYNRLVWGFFYRQVLKQAILPAVIEKFHRELDAFIRMHWPTLGSLAESGISLGVANSRLMLHRPGYVIKPHRDPRWAFLTCIVYLQKRDDVQAYGTQFYRLREEREPSHHSPLWVEEAECELVKDVSARRNTAVIFLNSTGAHGASVPADAPANFDRYIYQVQFGPDATTKQMLIEGLEGEARLAWATARSKY